jgi:hypothetical protein
MVPHGSNTDVFPVEIVKGDPIAKVPVKFRASQVPP